MREPYSKKTVPIYIRTSIHWTAYFAKFQQTLETNFFFLRVFLVPYQADAKIKDRVTLPSDELRN